TCDCVVDMENHSNGKLEIVIDATSLWSDNDKLTSHLKNPDFFDVRKYPKITFKSTKVEPGEGKAMLTAELVMLGKKQEIKVPVTADTTDDQVILEAEFKIDRTKWGMNYGEGKIDNDVAIDVVLVFVRA
ncbi:MAG: YceI family protein, partial [Planctomycetota bacterium]